jgi:shikimate kinase
MKTSVALIGFMGTGKTVVGRKLARRLGKEFIELDALIEKKAGRSIPDIFRQDGEIFFRELEIATTKEVAGRENVVIACGGGIVLNKINVDRLREKGITVCLTASPEVILRRTSKDNDERPLLAVSDRARQIEELMEYRQPFYEGSAEITVDTSSLSVEAVVKRIIEKLKEYESQN